MAKHEEANLELVAKKAQASDWQVDILHITDPKKKKENRQLYAALSAEISRLKQLRAGMMNEIRMRKSMAAPTSQKYLACLKLYNGRARYFVTTANILEVALMLEEIFPEDKVPLITAYFSITKEHEENVGEIPPHWYSLTQADGVEDGVSPA